MVPLVDLARLFVAVALLSFASFTDWKWRRAPNALWLIMAGAGVLLLAAEAVADYAAVAAHWPYLVVIPIFAALMYGFWYVGLLAGGADAKALMAMAVLAPFPIALGETLPLLPSPMPGAFVVLTDSLVAVLALPAAFFLRNVARRDLRFPAAFLGYRMDVDRLEGAHVWPMERAGAEGGRRIHYFPLRAAPFTEADLEALRADGDPRVWVTPKVPFMVPLTGGAILAFLVGDLLFSMVGLVL